MKCPKCKSENTQVVDSRDVDARTIRRRRECEDCEFRFTSYERIEPARLQVTKSDGRVQSFDREKLLHGMETAASGRIGPDLLSEIVDEIEIKAVESDDTPMSTRKIGNMVITRLKKIDEISYLRFVSVYKNFQQIKSFEEELTKLKK